MKTIIIVYIFMISLASHAQQIEKTTFRSFKGWQQLLTLSKKTNKNIFIDAYATWCGPCKQMDRLVYTNADVKQFLQRNFVSVKIQMDKSRNDEAEVKKLYKEASILSKKFNIDAYPALIFLSPEGDLIQIYKGFQDKETFLTTLKKVKTPELSYTTNIRKFKAGQVPVKDLLRLANTAKKYNDDSIALDIAGAYKNLYVKNWTPIKVANPDLPEFISNFPQLFNSQDSLIFFFYKHPEIADSLVHFKGYSMSIVSFFIGRDLIAPMVDKYTQQQNSEPDWASIEKHVTNVFDAKLANRLMRDHRLAWYYKKHDWSRIAELEMKKIETNGLDTAGIGSALLNNMLYEVIFKHSDDVTTLKKAAGYMEVILKNDESDSHLDTYANLLYKSGQKAEAIKQEEKALNLAKKRNDAGRESEYKNTLVKMRNGEITW